MLFKLFVCFVKDANLIAAQIIAMTTPKAESKTARKPISVRRKSINNWRMLKLKPMNIFPN
jgi:hypothetical protein